MGKHFGKDDYCDGKKSQGCENGRCEVFFFFSGFQLIVYRKKSGAHGSLSEGPSQKKGKDDGDVVGIEDG